MRGPTRHAPLFLLLLLGSFLQALLLFRSGAVHSNDFKHLWAGAFLLLHDASPYVPESLFRVARAQHWDAINPFVYLPTTGLLLRPLAALGFQKAVAIWFWFNWALAWAVVAWTPRLLRLPRGDFARLLGAVFLVGGMPFMRQMTAGQMNVVMAALLVLAAAALLRRRSVLLGALLALAFAWKIAPALLIALLIPLRRPRAAVWAAGLTCLLLGASILLHDWPVHLDAARIVSQMGYGRSTWSEFGNDFHRDPANQSINSLLHHLLTHNRFVDRPWMPAGEDAANAATRVVTLLLLAAWFGTALARRRASPAGDDALFWAAALLMLLAPSLMWDHYAVQALPALMWLAGAPRRGPARATALLLILALLMLPWNYAAPPWRSGAGLLLMSIRLWPTLALYAWLLLESRHDAN